MVEARGGGWGVVPGQLVWYADASMIRALARAHEDHLTADCTKVLTVL